jgi:hypothetical protein
MFVIFVSVGLVLLVHRVVVGEDAYDEFTIWAALLDFDLIDDFYDMGVI